MVIAPNAGQAEGSVVDAKQQPAAGATTGQSSPARGRTPSF